MPIPDNFIEDVKSRVDICDVIGSRVKLKKAGSDFSGCCPFHDEKTPSFTVSPTKQFYHCFGCGASGDAVEFLIEHDRLEFRDALKILADMAGLEIPADKPLTPEQEKQVAEYKRISSELPEVLNDASGFFYNALKENQAVCDYLKNRGVTGETAKAFRLGASASVLGQSFDQALLLEGGLIKERDNNSGFYDFFRDRLMFPVRNERGQTIAFGGRVLDDTKPKYLNTSESKIFDKSKTLYGLYEALQADRKPENFIVVEGYMDVVSLAQAGVTNALATMGTAFTPHHAKLAFRYVDELVMCFDGDKAGLRASERVIDAVAQYVTEGKMVKVMFLDSGDPDDFVNKHGLEAFNELVADAEPLSQAMIKMILKGDEDSLELPEIQVKVVKRAVEILGKFPESVYKDSVSKVVAKKLGVALKDLKLPRTPSRVESVSRDEVTLAPDFVSRFKLVEGSTNVFDSNTGSILKKAEFIAQVSKERANAWFNLSNKPTITEMEAYGFDQDNPFERYVLLHGTMEAWDRKRWDSIPINALRISLGENYKLWENSPMRQQIDHDRLVFDPKCEIDEDDSYINRFRGLPLEPASVEDCNKNGYKNALPIFELLENLCNGDKDAIHWVTCWLAYPLQNVGAKMDTSLLFHGVNEGSGKTLLFSVVMNQIYGMYAGEFGQQQLDSAWNAWQADKLYGVFDEVISRKDTYSGMGPLKQMVTSQHVMIERKFRESVSETNYLNAVFLSNETLPFPISSKDRRWFVMWPKVVLDYEFLERFKQVDKTGGVAEFYRYLLEYDLEGFDQRTKPPKTADKQALIEYGMKGWEVFLRDWSAGDLPIPFKACLVSDLYKYFQVWCREQGQRVLPQNKLVVELKRHLYHHKYRYMEGGIKTGVERNMPFFVPGGELEIAEDRGKNTVKEWATFAVTNFRNALDKELKHGLIRDVP